MLILIIANSYIEYIKVLVNLIVVDRRKQLGFVMKNIISIENTYNCVMVKQWKNAQDGRSCLPNSIPL